MLSLMSLHHVPEAWRKVYFNVIYLIYTEPVYQCYQCNEYSCFPLLAMKEYCVLWWCLPVAECKCKIPRTDSSGTSHGFLITMVSEAWGEEMSLSREWFKQQYFFEAVSAGLKRLEGIGTSELVKSFSCILLNFSLACLRSTRFGYYIRHSVSSK